MKSIMEMNVDELLAILPHADKRAEDLIRRRMIILSEELDREERRRFRFDLEVAYEEAKRAGKVLGWVARIVNGLT